MRIVITASLIFLFWFILSGHTEALLLLLGLASTLLTIFLSWRMKVIDHESYPFHLSYRLFRYYFFLGKEIFLANIDVVKRIINPRSSISPQIIELDVKHKTDLSKVIYANSITLTPGTVTLALQGDKIKVHALSKAGVINLQSGQMANKVPDIEVKGK